ncbi:hypothetical protein BD311DRAFT_120987 [Dichomitus squalens]|nr:hypothetical protein BD311DRAFT_120987 [Dichomitus squalens]
MEQNPWAPSGPGKHGYWFCRPVSDKKHMFHRDEERHVFMGTSQSGGYHYCGYYRVAGVGWLTPEEWKSLSHPNKAAYMKSICRQPYIELKQRGASSFEQLASKLGKGDLLVPYVQLQCIEFDPAFYGELCRANDSFFEKEGFALHDRVKRRRITEEGGREDDEYESESASYFENEES